eukprot:249303_1
MANFWEWSKDVSFVNRFIFPAPKPSSYNKDSFPDELLFVPPKEKLYTYYKQFKMEQANKDRGVPNNAYDIHSPKYNQNKLRSNEQKQQYCDAAAIPCIYIERKYRLSEATHLLLYLHGNAEDLGKCYPIIDYIRMKLQVNILAPEYPGYGVSSGDACENSVADMVQNVYEFAISPYGLNVPPSRIIVYGFSIGSAAALSCTNFDLKRIYIPDEYLKSKIKKHSKTYNDYDWDDEEPETKEKEANAYSDGLLHYGKPRKKHVIRKYFLSTFLDECPHPLDEHNLLFGDNNRTHFYTCDEDGAEDGDPFERLPLASLLNILRKGNVEYPTSVNKQHLLSVARKHGLIPPLTSCKKANVVRKYSLLIIVCPFASISQVVADKIGVFASYLLSERFKNIEAVKKVHGPLLIIHGKEDSIIPYQHSIEIHKTAQKCDIQPTHIELLDGCDHNTMDLRKITNIVNKFFKHQFNLCKSQRRMNSNTHVHEDAAEDKNKPLMNGHVYPKTNHNNGRVMNEFVLRVPSYCWLKPEQEAHELTDEDKLRMKKKQEQDDEEYAFNLFMKQLLQHESMQTASSAHASAAAVHLSSNQSKKLGKFFGDELPSVSVSTEVVEENDINIESMLDPTSSQNEPEYSLSQALRLQPHDIILPPDSSSN